MGLDLNSVPKEDEKIVRPNTIRKDSAADKDIEEQKVQRPATAKNNKAAPKKEPENYFAAAMQKNEAGDQPVKAEVASKDPP